MSNIFDLFDQIKKKNISPAGQISYLLVGLGNPGEKYTFTRHNTGFLALDFIAQKIGAEIKKCGFKSLYGEGAFSGHRVLLLKPQTFMNLSGEAVQEAAAFYKIPPENILVLCDDVNFDVGALRIKRSGSDGGQNGVKNIILRLGSDAFPRIKIGIGKRPSPDFPLADYVLSKYTDAEQKVLFSTFDRVYDSVQLIFNGEMDKAMNLYNR